MKKILFLIILIIVCSRFLLSQEYSECKPIYGLIDYLDITFSDELKNDLKNSNESLALRLNNNDSQQNILKFQFLSIILDSIRRELSEKGSVLKIYFDSIGLAEIDEMIKMGYLKKFYYYHLINKDINIEVFFDSVRTNMWIYDSTKSEDVSKEVISGDYIPINIYDCINILNDSLDTSRIKMIKEYKNEKELIEVEHLNMGMFIRNQFHLWHASRLKSYFNELGIKTPDYMSSIILIVFYRSLISKDISFKDLIYEYKWYEKKHNQSK